HRFYIQSHQLGAVCLISSIPSNSSGPGREANSGSSVYIKTWKCLISTRFLRHLSVPSLLRPVCFPAAAYPVGTGSAMIRHTIPKPTFHALIPLRRRALQTTEAELKLIAGRGDHRAPP